MNRPFSFKKENRLKKKAEIEACYKSGRLIRSAYFRAYYRSSSISRLGISVPSRHGNAVFRNKEKRSVREIFRRSKNDFPGAFDLIIVMAKKPPDDVSKLSDLNRIFKCLQNIKPS
jgi:ribonuclease P protein component